MKNLFVTLSFLLISALAANAQTATGKEHVCNAQCTAEAHVLLHGEQGHVCGDACKAMMGSDTKPHQCTAACTASAHVYAHGETGHVCGSACINTKEHVCNAACTPSAHVYAHGEKGHTCTTECKN